MASPTLYATLDDDTQLFYDKVLLVRALPNLLHDKFGLQKTLPSRSTRKMLFRRYNALGVATTALTEGVTPAGSSLARTDVSVTLSQYGDFVTVSDVATWASRDAVLTEAAEVLGEQAGQSLDQVYRDILVAGTGVTYANGAARTAVNSVVDANDLDRVIRSLKNNNAKFFTRMIKASTGIGTSPIRSAYWAITNPDVEFTVEGITGFKSRAEYPGNTEAMDPYEIGSYKNVRFVSTTFGKIFADAGAATIPAGIKGTTAVDVYATLFFGRDAYGVVPMSGHALENIVKPLGSGGSADPLNQRATSGWKAYTTSVILNDNFMQRLESGAST